MHINKIITTPYQDQLSGTSGLRKKTKIFYDNKFYLENYIQSCLSVCRVDKGKPVILGGDGRYYNDVIIQKTLKILLANGFNNILVCRYGLLSTPACSNLIRKKNASLGFIFTASHNPGGENGDIGIKLNISGGAPAPVDITDKIYEYSKNITSFFITNIKDIDLNELNVLNYGDATVQVIDGISDYVEMLKEIFDFKLIKKYLQSNKVLFDAMHAVTGPYVERILIKELAADRDSIINHNPSPDFSGKHPDPNPKVAKDLYKKAFEPNCIYTLLAASDGDGDRNMILGKDIYINPCDSLAVITDYAKLIPYFKSKVSGVARSMPTSRAVDLVARKNNIKCYVTPTGWKFFSYLLNTGEIQICGEESFGTSSMHIREKDGIWAFLYWLNILAITKKDPKSLMEEHFNKYGRYYYARYDYEGLGNDITSMFMKADKQIDYSSYMFFENKITDVGYFNFTDPSTMEIIEKQGYQVIFGDLARFVIRLSGTGTKGVTLRLYLEVYNQDYNIVIKEVITPLANIAIDFINNELFPLKKEPDFIV